LFKTDEEDSVALEAGLELDDDSGTVPLDKADVADEEDSSTTPEDAGSPELEDTPIAGEDSAPTVTGAVEDESSPQALNTNDNATQKAKNLFHILILHFQGQVAVTLQMFHSARESDRRKLH
jgi:hypothetical protein